MDGTIWVSLSSYWASHWESLVQCRTSYYHHHHHCPLAAGKISRNLSKLPVFTVISSIVLLAVTGHYECVRWRMRYDLMMKLVRAGLLYLTTCLRLRGMLAGLSLPAPAVTTATNIITIRGTHAYTSLHHTGTTMFNLNMRGLCHASVDTLYSNTL